MTTPMQPSFLKLPGTRLGRWAASLGAVFVALYLINTLVFMPLSMDGESAWWQRNLLPFYGIFMMLCGLVSGMLGLVAVIRRRERSWMVWLTLLPGAFVIIFLLGEFLFPH